MRTLIPYLHVETRVLPVLDRLSMLCQQFLARALQTDHPSHNVALAHPGPRGIKVTLRWAFFKPNFYRRYTDRGTPSGAIPLPLTKLPSIRFTPMWSDAQWLPSPQKSPKHQIPFHLN